MKIQYDFLFLRDLAVCMKTKHFLCFDKKRDILIPDLYIYNIKIQTNIDQNAVKYLRKITAFFEIIFEDFFLGVRPASLTGSLA